YFSSAPAPLDSVDPAQYQALKAFKDSCKSRGLYASYADVDDFRRQLSKDLQIVMNADGVGTLDAMAPPKTTSGVAGALSAEALLLPSAASADGSGTVLFERFGGGAEISSNDRVFNEDSTPRTLARWEGAIEELEKGGLLRATSDAREVFELTRDGFTA